MKECDLPKLSGWETTMKGHKFKLFVRKDKSIIIQIQREGEKEPSEQADLNYLVDTYISMEDGEDVY